MTPQTLDHSAKTLERLPVTIFDDDQQGSKKVADDIADLIIAKQKAGEHAVLGLATGATPIKVYKELVRKHKEENLSFINVVTFNLDEYYPMEKSSILSYYYFMHHHLFDHVDIPKENVNIPDGSIPIEDVKRFCEDYEAKIDEYGGMDIQLLGIGRTGHVGFNEPPSFKDSPTRLVKLDPITISDATREFIREELVPRRAITMGIKSIFKARKIYLMAWGEKKAAILKEAVEGNISEDIPASFLQNHPNVEVIIDEHATLELTRFKTPWIVSLCQWDDNLARRAVIWLSQKISKPILKLTEEDYKLNELGDLLVHYGNAQDLNVKMFTHFQHTITGWPGGKPNTDDTNRPERSTPAKKRVIIFSPHPDDDVISMGGTFLRLVEQGHDVHVAYQTSGNIAVFDSDARRFTDFAYDFMEELLDADLSKHEAVRKQIHEAIKTKISGDIDHEYVRKVKGLIRKGEAAAGARYCGLEDDHIHFLNLPFYETGAVEKSDPGEKDFAITKNLLNEIKPHQIYAAGDLRDPHGTHRVCLDLIIDSLAQLKHEKTSWLKDCYFWLYRGAWHEWPLYEIEMAVPLSPSDMTKKRNAIFKHQSQKDRPVFPGSDSREFWQRAEDRNRDTAKQYDLLGLTEYEAIEAFVRYKF